MNMTENINLINEVVYTTQLKNIKEKRQVASIPDFIDLVKGEQANNVCICLHIDSSNYVKPYFDIDKHAPEYDPEIHTYILNTIPKSLSMYFDVDVDKKVNHADNSRFDHEKKEYKHSYHFVVKDVKVTVSELRELCEYLNKTAKYKFDTSVYRSNGLMRFVNQKKNPKDPKPRLSSDNLEDYIINVVDKNAKRYVKLFEDEDNVKPKKVKKGSVAKNVVTNNNFEPSYVQLLVLGTVLDELDNKYSDDYEYWRNIGFALKDWCNHRSVYDLYDKWSQRNSKYEKDCCVPIWNSEYHGDNKITFGTLVHYHQQTNICKIHPVLSMKPLDMMVGIEDVKNTNIIKFNQEYITNKDGTSDIIKKYKDRFIVVKSHTGSGKTCLMEHINKIYRKKGYRVISITSRRSLARKHSEQLELSYYEEMKYNDEFVHNLSIQLDSLLKVQDEDDVKFVLFIDEINSLIGHLTNGMDKMSKNRSTIMNKLFSLIDKSYFTLSVDADINSNSMRFIMSRIATKKCDFYWNEYKLINQCPVLIHDDKTVMINKIVDRIEKSDKPLFICSDRYGDFEKDVVIPVLNKLSPEKKDKCRFYSSKDGNKDDFKNTDDWNDKYIFCTPSIVYGIDMNFEAEVFGFYYGKTMNAVQVCQQLARVRKPTTINVWFKSSKYQLSHYSVDDIKKHYECQMVKTNLFSGDMIQKWTSDQIEDYKKYAYQLEYHDHILMNLRYHTLQILETKGHTIKNFICQNKPKLVVNKITKKEISKIKHVEFDKLFTSINIDSIDKSKYELYKKRIEIIGWDCKDQDEYSELDKRLIVDDRLFTTYLRMRLMNKSIEDLEKLINIRSDVFIETVKTDLYKVLVLKQYLKSLEINDIFGFDFKEAVRKNDINTTLEINNVKLLKAYKIRNKKYIDKKVSKLDHYKLALDCTYHLFGQIMENTKVKVNQKKHYFKSVNNDYEYLKSVISDKTKPKYDFID